MLKPFAAGVNPCATYRQSNCIRLVLSLTRRRLNVNNRTLHLIGPLERSGDGVSSGSTTVVYDGISMKLSGIFAAITTPFDHNGDIYRVKIEHNLSRWNANALAGYVVGSSAGEGVLLSHDEKIAVWELSAKSAAAGRTLIRRCLRRGSPRSLPPKLRALDTTPSVPDLPITLTT